MTTKIKNTRINHGGLMRCCLETIFDYIDEHEEEDTVNGLILSCKYEITRSDQIILNDNVWHWNKLDK